MISILPQFLTINQLIKLDSIICLPARAVYKKSKRRTLKNIPSFIIPKIYSIGVNLD